MTAPTTPEERAEIVRLRENATVWNGPVTTTQNRDGWYQACGPELINRAAAEQDAAYIVAACNLAPRLVADVARLERERDAYREKWLIYQRTLEGLAGEHETAINKRLLAEQRAERAESAMREAERQLLAWLKTRGRRRAIAQANAALKETP